MFDVAWEWNPEPTGGTFGGARAQTALVKQAALSKQTNCAANPNNDQQRTNCEKLNNAAATVNLGLLRFKPGNYKYMSSRNNNFSNRAQKAKLTTLTEASALPEAPTNVRAWPIDSINNDENQASMMVSWAPPGETVKLHWYRRTQLYRLLAGRAGPDRVHGSVLVRRWRDVDADKLREHRAPVPDRHAPRRPAVRLPCPLRARRRLVGALRDGGRPHPAHGCHARGLRGADGRGKRWRHLGRHDRADHYRHPRHRLRGWWCFMVLLHGRRRQVQGQAAAASAGRRA